MVVEERFAVEKLKWKMQGKKYNGEKYLKCEWGGMIEKKQYIPLTWQAIHFNLIKSADQMTNLKIFQCHYQTLTNIFFFSSYPLLLFHH